MTFHRKSTAPRRDVAAEITDLIIRKLEEGEEREIYKSYLDSRNGATSNLGELLRKGMADLEQRSQSSEGEPEGGGGEEGEE